MYIPRHPIEDVSSFFRLNFSNPNLEVHQQRLRQRQVAPVNGENLPYLGNNTR